MSKGITWKLSGSPGMLSINIRLEHCQRIQVNQLDIIFELLMLYLKLINSPKSFTLQSGA